MKIASRVIWALAGVVLLVAVLILLMGCQEKPVQTRESPQPVAVGEAACKAELGYVAMQAVSRLDEQGNLDASMDERNGVMLDIINEQGSFPASCDDYTLSEMNPWMMYAGSIAWYCKSIDRTVALDPNEDFGGRPLGEWIAEYQVTCPLV